MTDWHYHVALNVLSGSGLSTGGLSSGIIDTFRFYLYFENLKPIDLYFYFNSDSSSLLTIHEHI